MTVLGTRTPQPRVCVTRVAAAAASIEVSLPSTRNPKPRAASSRARPGSAPRANRHGLRAFDAVARVRRSIDFASKAGLIDGPVEVDKILDTRLLPEINDFSREARE